MTAASAAPVISVVIPVRNDPVHLRACLERLAASRFAAFETIVVDDASTDDTADAAERFGARVLRLEANAGPAEARNRGARIARGRYLFFLDADVLVGPDTLARIEAAFRADPSLDALFGSYDRSPSAPNLVSQYKNLFHHFAV